MPLNFHFTAIQILWTLTFAALLVLLIVLLGRDRIKRFPFFTTSIFLLTLRLLMSRLLFGKLSQMTLSEIFVTLGDVIALVSLLVLVEIARRAFVGLGRTQWITNTAGALLVAGFVVAAWGPWPAWKTLTADSQIAGMRLMQLASQKVDLLVSVLSIELGLLIVLFGRRFTGGWRSHAQLSVQGAWQLIATHTTPHTEQEYLHLIGLRDKIFNGNGALVVAVVIWWIVCLWIDEPGTRANGELAAGDNANAGVASGLK